MDIDRRCFLNPEEAELGDGAGLSVRPISWTPAVILDTFRLKLVENCIRRYQSTVPQRCSI